MGVEKWNPKMVPEFDPQNGVQKWHPKRDPIYFDFKSRSTFYKSKYIGPLFGCHFWTPFWGSNSGAIFGFHFSTPILRSKNGANFPKVFCCQSCIANTFFPANKHAYQNASVVISQLVASLNKIQSSTWSSLPKQEQVYLIATNVAHKQDGLEPQNLILWRSLHATPVFHMKNDSLFGGRQS